MQFERILSGLILMVLAGAPSAFGGDWLGWHAKNHYGTCDPCPEDVWEDMTEDVYGDDTMENRTPKPSSRWIGADAFERSDPGLVLEQHGDAASEFTAHTAHEHTLACHHESR